ncbi:Bleomycin resistance protein [Sulfitobacter noctilucicola]|uniref:Catechol 2,3-dioxygenase-like lactoylglutathione lyase family enzyme n=1 Tax=Sulfitobacter noctilucicola TaxID=1342301 RepID=A0A7W6M8N5_9RHOB|nr:bleomycin resistance protein [Sulfitobacter noctilucicola]KIN64391.1 Bleomycin resistance protein [Sulfitobacter noctilucicola]MBB4174450.1 catechol 2,3-dioxygenase-like lactoylglutathione lyase family enzyme [Sulfitobacter noctilucicola]
MTPDRVTANLPSRDFDRTCAFYGLLGFDPLYRDDGWLILRRGTMEVEFFAHPDLVLAESWFSACIRVDDLDGLRTSWHALDLPDDPMDRPRDLTIQGGDGKPRFFVLIDCDGSLIRCIDNGSV